MQRTPPLERFWENGTPSYEKKEEKINIIRINDLWIKLLNLKEMGFQSSCRMNNGVTCTENDDAKKRKCYSHQISWR